MSSDARWAARENLAKGETVCLLMPNRPEYMAAWIGITSAGGVAALINTNLVGTINAIDLGMPAAPPASRIASSQGSPSR